MLARVFSVVALAVTIVMLGGCDADAGSGGEDAAAGEPGGAKPTVVPGQLTASLAERFAKARPDLVVTEVVATEAEGVYQVFFEGKGSVYAIGAGDFFFVGDLYRIQRDGIVNVTEQASNGPRAELIAAISEDDMIVFSPPGEVKASVVVFTDVDCGYCRKLHREVPKMNELGIEIKYLAYPRAGVGSKSYDKIASAWCADDRREAMNILKAGEEIPINVCDGNPVAKQFNIGIRAGLSGTPALVLESGELIPGYVPAEKLASTLGI